MTALFMTQLICTQDVYSRCCLGTTVNYTPLVASWIIAIFVGILIGRVMFENDKKGEDSNG